MNALPVLPELVVQPQRLLEWSSSLFPFVFDHLWQTTVFALLAVIVVSALRGAPAKARHSVWLIAFAKFLIPTASVAFLAGVVGIGIPQTLSSLLWFMSKSPDLGLGIASEPHDLYLIGWTVWLIGTLVLGGRWFLRHSRCSSAARSGRELDFGREREALRRARLLLGFQGEAKLIASRQVGVPSVWGVLRPVILLPVRITDHLDDEELNAVILHELAHVARRDNLIGNLTMAVCCLLWFHPLIWWMDRRLLAERERACDELVVQKLKASKAYASGLLKVVQFRIGWGLTGTAGAADSDLGRRVEWILNGRLPRNLALWHRVLLGALTSILLLLSMSDVRSTNSSGNESSVAATDKRNCSRSGERRKACRKEAKPVESVSQANMSP